VANEIEYVCLFIFTETMDYSILVRKTKGPTPDNPNGQAGRLNGIGGKMETCDYSSRDAVIREAQEECGVDIGSLDLRHFSTERYQYKAIVHYFYLKDQKIFNQLVDMRYTNDGDDFIVVKIDELLSEPSLSDYCVWNVPYLLLMSKILDCRELETRPVIYKPS